MVLILAYTGLKFGELTGLNVEDVDITAHASAISTMVRIASRIGTQRVARDITPDPLEYARAHEAAE